MRASLARVCLVSDQERERDARYHAGWDGIRKAKRAPFSRHFTLYRPLLTLHSPPFHPPFASIHYRLPSQAKRASKGLIALKKVIKSVSSSLAAHQPAAEAGGSSSSSGQPTVAWPHRVRQGLGLSASQVLI